MSERFTFENIAMLVTVPETNKQFSSVGDVIVTRETEVLRTVTGREYRYNSGIQVSGQFDVPAGIPLFELSSPCLIESDVRLQMKCKAIITRYFFSDEKMRYYFEAIGQPEVLNVISSVRGSGRTTEQIKNAAQGALFVWCNNNLSYPNDLARKLKRTDLKIVASSSVDVQLLAGTRYPEIVIDHAAALNEEQRELIRTREGLANIGALQKSLATSSNAAQESFKLFGNNFLENAQKKLSEVVTLNILKSGYPSDPEDDAFDDLMLKVIDEKINEKLRTLAPSEEKPPAPSTPKKMRKFRDE